MKKCRRYTNDDKDAVSEIHQLFFPEFELHKNSFFVYEKTGYVFEDNQGISGFFILMPYSPVAFPRPVLPVHWRPYSNLAQVIAIADKRPGLMTNMIKLIVDNVEIDHFVFPLVLTAYAHTNDGKRLLRLLGFDMVEDTHYALKINSSMDVYDNLKRNIKLRVNSVDS